MKEKLALQRALAVRDARIKLLRLRGQTLERIGKQFDLTRERVRQIIAKLKASK